MANNQGLAPADKNRFREELRVYGFLQPVRSLVDMARAADVSDPLSVDQLLKTVAQAQLNEMETNWSPKPRYQESLTWINLAKEEYVDVKPMHWAPTELTFTYKANKSEIEAAKAAIESGVTTVEGVAEAIHNGWKAAVADFVANTSNYYTAKYSEEEVQRHKNTYQSTADLNYSALGEDRLEKAMYRVMANTIIQAYKTAGIIAP